jgi:hypothetical protein
MRSKEFVTERLPTPDEMQIRGVDPNDIDDVKMSNSDRDIPSVPGPVGFTALQAIGNILGRDRVCTDEKYYIPGKRNILVTDEGGLTRNSFDYSAAMGDDRSAGAVIYIDDIFSSQARNIAIAVHEAYHAWMFLKSGGTVFQNEKMVNRMAIRWLRKHLSGMNLQIATEEILHSNLSYNHKGIDK